jgi:hypothetical protein
MCNQPKFPELPVEVQVALINAAASMAVTKVTTTKGYNSQYNFFETEYRRICDSLYKENKGR